MNEIRREQDVGPFLSVLLTDRIDSPVCKGFMRRLSVKLLLKGNYSTVNDRCKRTTYITKSFWTKKV